MKATVICDGRGNAGTGACAAVLILPGEVRAREARKIDATTNIVAEHLSIQLGIELALEARISDLLILNDSQTPVFQVQGRYQTKEDHLKPLIAKTHQMLSQFSSWDIRWVPREVTEIADQLCRLADPKISNARRTRPGGDLPDKPVRKNPFEPSGG
jgi:ribonuclease HI